MQGGANSRICDFLDLLEMKVELWLSDLGVKRATRIRVHFFFRWLRG